MEIAFGQRVWLRDQGPECFSVGWCLGWMVAQSGRIRYKWMGIFRSVGVLVRGRIPNRSNHFYYCPGPNILARRISVS